MNAVSTRRNVITASLGLAGSVCLPYRMTAFAAKPAIDKSSGFCSPQHWANEYESRWGLLGRHSASQIHNIIHAKNGVYDDSEGVFAWIIHYWLRAFAKMAIISDDEKYLHSGMSLIDFMLDHTDEKRIARGEISENYLREPLGLQGTGRGGPFWKRWEEANALNTGQVAHGILHFVDVVFENRARWPAYAIVAEQYFEHAKTAVDAFNADWKTFGNAGSYYYRDSSGSNVLGETETAFNQSATMCSAHLLLDKWEADDSRRDKASRLARYWTGHFMEIHADGAVTWPYIIHPELQHIEDTGHASVDLDFLVLAHERGIAEITPEHIEALVNTFKKRVWRTDGALNRYVDGSTDKGFNEHYNAGFGWFGLGRYDSEIHEMALKTYQAFYRSNAKSGEIWARPMLGWANLLEQHENC